MSSQAFPPLVEAFLILEQPRQRLSHWTQALAPLDDERAPPFATVTAYYDPTCDQALLGLRYDQLALGGDRLSFIVEVALLAEIGMIQPSELSEGDRRRFLGERLARCTVTVSHQRNVVGALTELVRRVREQKQPRPSREDLQRVPKPPPAAPIPMLVARKSGSMVAIVDPLLVQPRSTRDSIGKLQRDHMQALASAPDDVAFEDTQLASPSVLAPPPPRPAAPPPVRDRGTPPPIPMKARTSGRHVIARASSPQPRALVPARDRASTVQMAPLAAQELAARAVPPVMPVPPAPAPAPPPAEDELTKVPEGSHEMFAIEPYAPVATPLPDGCIFARYLRSGRWVPLRVGALSLRGAVLMGALPRLHDQVEVAFAFAADHRAIVRGLVHKVSTQEEAAQRGAASFSVAFVLDEQSRRRLTELLQAARAAKITIKPPPARGNRRYPVEWPVCLGTSRGAIRADALDVSREGMFVRPANALTLEASLGFSIALDDAGQPVCGRSRVVRFIDEAGARSCGLAPGYGLRIVDMARGDLERWTSFLARVERRSERRVLIGAAAGRLRELQSGLAAAGYAVAGATDPDALVQLASRDERAVDACLIDAAWLPPGPCTTWSQALFPTRTVPCIAMRGDARRAREAIDQVLSIV